jgi:isoquinoline 1-oxidoreductase beta subunit
MSKLGKWSRRGFIAGGVVVGGGLVIGVALRQGDRRGDVISSVTTDGDELLNIWVKINEAGEITAIVPHSEMGQGAQTALAQMLADEMDAKWSDVGFEEAPATDDYANWALGKGFILGDAAVPEVLIPTVDGAFYQVAKAMRLQITGGSASVRTTGVHGMRVAGAAAREMLLKAAAGKWQVAESELTASESVISHTASGRTATYAELASAAALFTPSPTPKLKDVADFKIMGKHVQRHDIPSKVDGSAQFGIDAQVPGMQYAAIKAAPVFGSAVASVDSSKAEQRAGVTQVVNLGNAVAVVASGYWLAEQALKDVDVKWTATSNDRVNTESLREQFRRDITDAATNGTSESDVELGNYAEAFAGAERVLEATYEVPFLAHACMEPMNATASVNGDMCEVWVGAQNPMGFRYEVAAALELDPENVTVHQHFMGGGFGRRSIADSAIQAAMIAREVGTPVKLIWSRAEDMQHDIYRPGVASKFRAAVAADGQVLAWDNVYHEKHEPAEAPVIPYAIAAQHIHYTDSPTHLPFGPWRSVDHSQHGFFTEAFFDEVAEAADEDPYQLRRKLLADKPRHLKVLDLAAEKAGWGEPVVQGKGRGISLQESFGSLVAQVVDVTLTDGKIGVDRVVCAVDAGFAVSPDGFVAQMESGISYGLSAALYGEISVENGAVQQTAFHDYPVVRMQDSPVIETHILNSGETIGGAGEPGTPGIAPALANAIYQATGTRVRKLPVSQYDFNYRVEEQEELI